MGNCVTTKKNTCNYCKIQIPPQGLTVFHRCLPGVILQNAPTYTIHPPITKTSENFLFLKAPQDKEFTRFSLIKQPKIVYEQEQISSLLSKDAQYIKHCSFQQKFLWFHSFIDKKLRIDFTQGHQKLLVDPSNLIYSCQEKFLKLNLRKQLKIVFQNNPNSLDAGGLLRQFFHLSLKEIFHNDLGVLNFCRTKQTSYNLSIAYDLEKQTRLMYFRFLGRVVAKSLFERIPVNCPLSRALFRKLIGQPIYWSDFFDYDEQLYNSYRKIIQDENCQQLCLTFTIGIPELKIPYHQLIKNGKNIIVTDQNKEKYIIQCINFLCSMSIQNNLAIFCQAFYEVIPKQLISVFEPYELKMMLNGPDQIDVEDWRKNTQYDDYSQEDLVIKWFWQAMKQLSQQFLRNFLHNSTGSNRLPVQGFKFLESNRGQIKKFTIRKIPRKDFNQLPKFHTCFNRLDLPEYQSYQKVQNVLLTISAQQIHDFGDQ